MTAVETRSYGLGEQQWAALHHAAAHGGVGAVSALLRGGADPKARTLAGQTAETLAAARGNQAVAELLGRGTRGGRALEADAGEVAAGRAFRLARKGQQTQARRAAPHAPGAPR